MSRSNWKGSAGFQSVDDPTGVLDNICLYASAGRSQRCEDYVAQEIGTSNAFAKVHYKILFDFAVPSNEEFDGEISIIARAGNYTTDPKTPVTAQDCYIAAISTEKTVLIRRINNVSTVLNEQNRGYSFVPNTKYNLSLECYGNTSTGATRVRLYLNGVLIGSVTDYSGLQITTGSVGLGVFNSSIYVNNFAVMELDSNGSPV